MMYLWSNRVLKNNHNNKFLSKYHKSLIPYDHLRKINSNLYHILIDKRNREFLSKVKLKKKNQNRYKSFRIVFKLMNRNFKEVNYKTKSRRIIQLKCQ